jgi:hypothetical protein
MESGVQHTSGLNEERARIIDQLVRTYRELNMKYRPLGDDALETPDVRSVIERMRGDEMLFAQALKERVTGVGTATHDGEDEPIIGTESPDDSTIMVISQFGNARATTLSLLKQLDETEWNRQTEDGKTIFDHARELADSDRNQLAKLERHLGHR